MGSIQRPRTASVERGNRRQYLLDFCTVSTALGELRATSEGRVGIMNAPVRGTSVVGEPRVDKAGTRKDSGPLTETDP